MRALSAPEILWVWESGPDQHPLDRALTLLLAADPGATRADLASLDVGERNARLLHLRAATLGPTLGAYAECPACGERLEFTLDASDLRTDRSRRDETYTLDVDGVTLRFRLPDSRDLAAVAGCADPAAARRRLAERCVTESPIAPGDLPETAIRALAERMAACAPDAETLLDLSCPACGEEWQAHLDIAAFFWAEVVAQAKRLLREVDALARAYGWSEAEILGMSARRRGSYLELASS